MSFIRNIAAVSVLAGALAGPAIADEVDAADIVDFASGTPAVAAEVNANFSALIAAINDNAVAIAEQAERLSAVEDAAVDSVDGRSYRFMSFSMRLSNSNVLDGANASGLRVQNTAEAGTLSFSSGTGTLSSEINETELQYQEGQINPGDVQSNLLTDGSTFFTHVVEPAGESFTYSQSGNVISTSLGVTFYVAPGGGTLIGSVAGVDTEEDFFENSADASVVIGVRTQ